MANDKTGHRYYHMNLDLRGFIANAKGSDYKRMLKHPDGRAMSPHEAKATLLDELAKGHLVVPIGPCDHFDFSGRGCLGHPVPFVSPAAVQPKHDAPAANEQVAELSA